ncbi:hypothetical protein [Slackia equolifaciens]|uniref:hypothetical protein n=1 Tax=Slackia equolifaciens TaxID=498718 RepID=UPI00362CF141
MSTNSATTKMMVIVPYVSLTWLNTKGMPTTTRAISGTESTPMTIRMTARILSRRGSFCLGGCTSDTGCSSDMNPQFTKSTQCCDGPRMKSTLSHSAPAMRDMRRAKEVRIENG